MSTIYWKRKGYLLALVVALVLVFTACSEDESTKGDPDPTNTGQQNRDPEVPSQKPAEPEHVDISQAELEPADLRIFTLVNSITEEEFARTMEKPIKEKYPHYNLEYILSSQDNIRNLIITDRAPDVVITSITNLYQQMVPSALEYDLSDLIDKYDYDLDRFDPSLIESLRNASPNGEIYGLPKYVNGVVMFYNPDLFDRFGQQYPVSGMTWDEVYDLAATMTRVDDGQQYRGMSFFYNNMFAENPLSLPYFDAKEVKAAVNVPGFQKLINEYVRFYHIEGNTHAKDAGTELNNFYLEKNIAMNMSPLSAFSRFTNDLSFNWDIIAAPTFADQPGVGFQANTIYYFVSNANKKAEQAFQAVTELLTDEVQMMSSREGRGTSLRNEEIRAALGQDNPNFSDKNFEALYYNEFAPHPPVNAEAASLVSAQNILIRGFREVIEGEVDVNTMLRNVEEQINQAIAEALKAQN